MNDPQRRKYDEVHLQKEILQEFSSTYDSCTALVSTCNIGHN